MTDLGLDAGLTTIYGCHIKTLLKTTVYLDPEDYRRLKAIGKRVGRAPASLVRDAVARLARSSRRRVQPRSLGIGRSGRKDLSERAETLLKRMSQKQ